MPMKSIADYQFVRLLGEGNHGSFWLARPPQRLQLPDEYVAVKTLAHRATDADFARMANELKLYASVPSQHLVRLYDAGQQDGVLYYAGEYFPDGSLAAPSRPLARSEVLRNLADAARAAHDLHQIGVAHRDIKPANILLGADGGKLGDLGLAQILNPGQTVTGIGPVGTIEFLAPEVVRGQEASRGTDIWALGASMHRALTGRSIFPAIPDETLLDALRHVLNEQPTLAGPLSAEETRIIRSALEAEPTDRPGTALELAEAVQAEADRQLQATGGQ